ncbi:MAG: FKBP-type peptidyl-prolyl cis-trans isomerase [Saprospiraceae bacterium]|nr:FKBP-type peptidyl-prolyl cis-trans isomerase [Saprospiraceae bacterium]
MKKNQLFKAVFFAYWVLFAFISCNGLGEKTTRHGNKYTLLAKGNGVKMKNGDVAFCSLQKWIGDSLELSSDFKERVMPFTLYHPEDIRPDNLVQDVLSEMSLGDSVMILQKIDSFEKNKYAKFNIDHFTMVMKVVKVGIPGSSELFMDSLLNVEPIIQARRKSFRDSTIANLKEFIDSKKYESHPDKTNLDSGIVIYYLKHGEGPAIGKGKYTLFDQTVLFEDKSLLASSYSASVADYIITGTHATIEGLDKAISAMKCGDVAYLYIPYEMAYKEWGSGFVPPKTNLFIYLHIRKAIPVKRDEYIDYFKLK